MRYTGCNNTPTYGILCWLMCAFVVEFRKIESKIQNVNVVLRKKNKIRIYFDQ